MSAARPILPTLAAAAFLLGAAYAAASSLTMGFRVFTAEDARRLRVAEATMPISPVEIVDAAGQHRKLWNADPAVRAWLVTFVYTRCPSACLALGSEMQQLQASAHASGTKGVRFASLSFDREFDTPTELARYAMRFRADPALWTVGVPASDASLRTLLRESGVVVIPDGIGGYAHNAAIHVITSSGQLVAVFDMESQREALAFAATL